MLHAANAPHAGHRGVAGAGAAAASTPMAWPTTCRPSVRSRRPILSCRPVLLSRPRALGAVPPCRPRALPGALFPHTLSDRRPRRRLPCRLACGGPRRGPPGRPAAPTCALASGSRCSTRRPLCGGSRRRWPRRCGTARGCRRVRLAPWRGRSRRRRRASPCSWRRLTSTRGAFCGGAGRSGGRSAGSTEGCGSFA